MKIQRKSALPVSTEVLPDEGVVIAVVSVTGTVDSVQDIIEPGAYAKTLATRSPKVVWSHDWNTPIGRVDEAKELMPGDPHLPKTTADGNPWPKEAGALVVKTRFNLETQRGKDAFSDVKFFGTDGAWSIGYQVPVGGATVEQKTGIRRIKTLELYEVSPVLHGAHSHASTISVKSLADAAVEGAETLKAGAPLTCEECGGKTAEADSMICARCGGRMSEQTPAEAAIGGVDEKASRASLDRSPNSNWVEESGELPGYIREIARAIERDSGKDLSRAIAIAVSRVKKWAAGGGDVDADTRAKAAAAVAEWEALKAKNAARKKDDEKSASVETETKYWSAPSGSLEERQQTLREALESSFRPAMTDQVFDGPVAAPDVWVDTIATYDDHVICAVYDSGDRTTFRVGYTVNADGSIALGNAEPVELETVVVPKVDELELEVDDSLEPELAGEKALLRYEAKAGRVLSTANANRLKAAVEELVKVLQTAGVDIENKPDEKVAVADLIGEDELFELEKLKLAV